ncbi:hypothetical protein [Mucilaginibacter gilvus]|uniref:Addiction module protein n=1 Tax=Mucilaginibacter gilvus TaxID=2305909 RepID=A0A3S3US90_9SPHI|nr:hypothetical protein [Mucilaginibacter gilvus]RWY49490.1 hypothetical protein EPL05_18990 [Mucilaginibacter gilvus]
MSAAEVKETKTDLIAWIKQLSDISMLSMLESLKNADTGDIGKDWWDDLSPAQKENINAGLREAESGNVMSSKEFWAKLKDA